VAAMLHKEFHAVNNLHKFVNADIDLFFIGKESVYFFVSKSLYSHTDPGDFSNTAVNKLIIA